jgi:serine O-acetyltransferase
MKLSLSKPDLVAYVARQLNTFFPDETLGRNRLVQHVDSALERTEYCFSHINDKYFYDDDGLCFNHLHTDQYATFLYYLSNCAFRDQHDVRLASKVYALNKALHAVELFYEHILPDIFHLQHPVGTVLGRANYSNYICVYQRCLVGGNNGQLPSIGEGVVMFGGSAILGNCNVEGNCLLSVGTIVIDQDIPGNSIVFGRSPNTTIKPTRRNVLRDLFIVDVRGSDGSGTHTGS